MKTTIAIEGMHCGGCADRIRRVLEREPGVREVDGEGTGFVTDSFGNGMRRVECP